MSHSTDTQEWRRLYITFLLPQYVAKQLKSPRNKGFVTAPRVTFFISCQLGIWSPHPHLHFISLFSPLPRHYVIFSDAPEWLYLYITFPTAQCVAERFKSPRNKSLVMVLRQPWSPVAGSMFSPYQQGDFQTRIKSWITLNRMPWGYKTLNTLISYHLIHPAVPNNKAES